MRFEIPLTAIGLQGERGAVFYRDAKSVPAEKSGDIIRRVLRRDGRGMPVVWQLEAITEAQEDIVSPIPGIFEAFVIEGEVTLNHVTLHAGDFTHLPQGTELSSIRLSKGAKYLVFYEPDQVSGIKSPYIARGSKQDFVPGMVTKDKGVECSLWIKHLKNDPKTGARTFLCKQAPGVTVPWEEHPSEEEGYLLEGDYRLEEQLQGQIITGVYKPGGYFFRPPGIRHSGPESTTTQGSVWFIRTPANLEADFFEDAFVPEAYA